MESRLSSDRLAVLLAALFTPLGVAGGTLGTELLSSRDVGTATAMVPGGGGSVNRQRQSKQMKKTCSKPFKSYSQTCVQQLLKR